MTNGFKSLSDKRNSAIEAAGVVRGPIDGLTPSAYAKHLEMKAVISTSGSKTERY
jgi:hypothetical protein